MVALGGIFRFPIIRLFLRPSIEASGRFRDYHSLPVFTGYALFVNAGGFCHPSQTRRLAKCIGDALQIFLRSECLFVMSETILKLDNIVKTFPGTVANRGISLDRMIRELNAFLIPNSIENCATRSVVALYSQGLMKHPTRGQIRGCV